MIVPEHKRFLWKHKNHDFIHIGCVEKIQIHPGGLHPIADTLEESFEKSFLHCADFVSWVDEEWKIS